MIYYLVTAAKDHTIQTYLEHWGPELLGRIEIVPYLELFEKNHLPVGTYIFSDLERLTPAEVDLAASVWEQLERTQAGFRLLNHPKRLLRRYDLLSTLHAQDRNAFRVARATDDTADLRYPVFLREENTHRGSLTDKLHNRTQLDQAIVGAVMRGHRMRDLIVVEFCDTADPTGVYDKYSAFIIGDHIVPGHIDSSCDWVVKDTDLISPDIVAREQTYLEINPHEAWLRETFALAHVDYGRIDYGILDGRPQVWEINTNPIVALARDEYKPFHLPVKQMFAELIQPAFLAVETHARPDDGVGVVFDSATLRRQRTERRALGRARAHRKLTRAVKTWWPVRVLRRILHPLVVMLSPTIARISRAMTISKIN